MSPEIQTLFRERRSIRAYTDQPVARDCIENILQLARTAPSGANLQPGRFYVLTGQPLHALSAALAKAINAGVPETSEYSYFPEPMPKYLRARQVAAGRALYRALGIGRGDTAERARQFARNYDFFGAPVGIVVTIERAMGKGCFMDLGMTLMGLMIAAQSAGLSSTGIGALANYGPVIHDHLQLPAPEMVVCGMAIGYAQADAAENRTRTDREPLDNYARLLGFDGQI